VGHDVGCWDSEEVMAASGLNFAPETAHLARPILVKCVNDRTYIQETELGLREAFGQDPIVGLTLGKVYQVVAEEGADYRIIDDTAEDYVYPKTMFDVASWSADR
jgi:hypothetical protein